MKKIVFDFAKEYPINVIPVKFQNKS